MKIENSRHIISRTDRDYPYLAKLYRYLHAHPELSGQEQETSRRIAEELRSAGYRVTENIGGYGVVGVLKNGGGPAVMLRADMDALPVTENTGLAYASRVKAEYSPGEVGGVMHACGHDLHCAIMVGAARLLAGEKDRWGGTLLMVGQPAEESGGGAMAMLKDGLYHRFPRPDYVLGLHADPALPVGSVGIREGRAWAGMAAVEITIRGIGGHGALPHLTRDPIVLAARFVLALQTIVSREIDPLQPAIVSVGAIKGGSTANVIPSEVHLQLSIRFFDVKVKERILSALSRLSRGIALSAGIPEQLMPLVRQRAEDVYPPLDNDPELARRIKGVLIEFFGKDNVLDSPQLTLSDDFANFRRSDPPVPLLYLLLGVSDPRVIKNVAKGDSTGVDLKLAEHLQLHSPRFAPLPEPSIKTGVRVLSTVAWELLEAR